MRYREGSSELQARMKDCFLFWTILTAWLSRMHRGGYAPCSGAGCGRAERLEQRAGLVAPGLVRRSSARLDCGAAQREDIGFESHLFGARRA
jgi:hypothetical protein